MPIDKFIMDSGRAMRQPRLSTLLARRQGLQFQRDRLDAQIRATDDAIRRQVRINETAVAHRDDNWFVVKVTLTPEERIDEKLARQTLKPTLLRSLLKSHSRVRVSVRQVSEETANKVTSMLPPAPHRNK